MTDLTLEPFAVQLLWRSNNNLPMEAWKTLLAELLDEIGTLCAERGVIGHIKGFGCLPDGGYLRGSKVSVQHPADMELVTEIEALAEIDWALNVLVYGLSFADAQKIAGETTRTIANRRGIEVDWIKSEGGEQHHHHYTV